MKEEMSEIIFKKEYKKLLEEYASKMRKIVEILKSEKITIHTKIARVVDFCTREEGWAIDKIFELEMSEEEEE